MAALTESQMVALGAGVPPKQLKAAKYGLAVGTTTEDFAVRVVATVSRGPDEHGVVGETNAAVQLWGASAITAVLTSLGIGQKRLGQALRVLCDRAITLGSEQLGDTAFVPNQLLIDEINAIATEYSERLPKVQYSTSGKSGSVTVATTFTLLDHEPPTAAAAVSATRKPKPKTDSSHARSASGTPTKKPTLKPVPKRKAA